MAFDTNILHEKNKLLQQLYQVEVEMLKHSRQSNDSEVNKCLERYKEIKEEIDKLIHQTEDL